MSAKYSSLPDIDTAQDVYETEDPLPSVNKAEPGSDDEAVPTRSALKGSRAAESGASKEELDSSSLMQHDEAAKRFRKAEKRRERTQYIYPPSPTDPLSPDEPSPSRPVPLSQRLRALQSEILSLEKELADPANPLLFKEKEDDVVDPGELIRGLVDVRSRLDKIRKGKEGRGRLVGVILGQDGSKEVEKKDAVATAPTGEPEKPTVRTVVEMDRRVGELEKLVGSSTATIDESSTLPPPLLPLVTRLNAQLTLLTQPRHIDSVSRRLKLLLSDLDRASAAQHSHRRHPSQSNNAPSQIQEQILPLLSRLSPSLPHIPHILARLRTLSALHTSASEFESTLEGLEEEHRKMREAVGELEGAVESIEKSMGENREVVKGNVGGLETRVDRLIRRVDELALRNAPAAILKPSLAFSNSSARDHFKKLNDLALLLASDPIQHALATAAKSEQDDKSDLTHDPRRSIKQRKRPPPAAGSPQPYVGLDKQPISPFHPDTDGLRALRADELADYIREFNKTHSCRAHIWTRTKEPSSQLANPVIVRFTIPDVLVCYLTLGYSINQPALVAECITAFGPREKKSPYSQSDFLVYQSLSQHLASLLQEHPRASVQNLVTLLAAYDGLFLKRCRKCERVLSTEAHEPPVVRKYGEFVECGSQTKHSSSGLLCTVMSMLQVLALNPQEGEEGAPITVRIHFHAHTEDPIHVRLVVGNKAVNTAVRELEGFDYGRWQLDAAAPALAQLDTDSNSVLVTVQAVDAENRVLDSVPAGQFVYWDVKRESDLCSPSLGRPRAATHIPSATPHYASMPSPSLSDRLIPRSKTRSRKGIANNKHDKVALVRTGHHPADDSLYAHAPLLEIATPLESLCVDWTSAEMAAGRRLVRFHKVQDGRRVTLTCEPIHPDDYNDKDVVISCIHRQEVNACYVTSVDIIFLLERLTNDQFPVEEKNRIRRNLEGLRPVTVSKHKRASEAFFQLIMDFPEPKPRNIEKDLKVFEWCLLGQALEKIMAKYSIYTTSPTDSTSSLPDDTAPDFAQDDPLATNTEDTKLPVNGLLLHFDSDQYAYPVKQESDSSEGSSFSDSFPLLHEAESPFNVPEFGEAHYEGYDDGVMSMPF
uniref:DUF7082 domain-containing protein n=1 Tax=Mycena chlorophos TaxID=658473 RepID=A0ABQ0M303_MYCCL|nr:predicted protein [Mycena chlorophos]